jgi:PKD repeat protein
LKRKYILAILFLAITITFCGTAAAEEQNNIQDTQSDTNPQTTVNDQATTSPVQNNSTVDTSITTSTQNNTQDNPPDTNLQTTVNNQTANNETTQNTQNNTNNDITTTANEDPVVITFDDGLESTYTIAFPIMQQYGIKGTVYVVPSWIGAPGYLTLAQLTALHNAGWTIASHTWDHPALPTLTTAQITTELQTAINWLNNNGFADGAYHLAYPFGQYNNNVLQVASNLGIKTARTVEWGTISPNDNIDYLQLPIILMRSDTTRNDWQSELDASIAQGGTAIFLFHDIVTGNPNILEDVTVANFRTVIEYIAQTGVKTETISQWYNERVNIDSLSIGITSDKANYNPGENVVYNLDIFNNGANTATNVVVRDTLPAGLTFVSATNGGVYNAGVITWNLANLAANSHFTPSFTATVNQGTDGQNIQNTASASSTQVPTPVTSQATIHVNNPNTAAEIIINFDDGLASVYTTAFPIMQQYGIKGTVYVITEMVGSSGYLTQAQLTALHNAGWTIANHSYRHWWMPELTTAQITTEIQTAITWLNNNGFSDGAYHFAYPYGEYDSRVLQIESQLGIKTGRTIESGTINPNGNINYLELPSNGFTRTITTAQWKSWVDQAIATQTTSIILLHGIVTTPRTQEDVSVTTFTAFIQYLAQTGVKTPTISQWYDEVNNPAPVANFTATPVTGSAPLTVQFTDQSTGSSLSYSWDFNNDGTADSTAKSPTYTYSTAGTYTVKLTVTNTIGSNSLTRANYITVNNPATVANFTATPVNGTAPLNVQFTDRSTGSGLTYQWDFNNDGTVDSTAQNPAYIYSIPGTYTVKLTVNGTGGINSLTRANYITVNYPAPVANFTATPTSGTVPLNVQFTDQSTGTVTGWAWDFNNDGTTDSTIKNPSYTYSTAGTYTIKLTVSNSGGSNSITRTNYITVNNIAPVANFTATPTSGTVPLRVQFTDQSTGNPTSYAWDFNNDGTVDSTAKNPLYTYSTPGTYTVKLNVSNSVGSNSLTRTNYITVNNAPPVANFTATPTSGIAPLTVQFTDKSTGSGLTYQWDFNNDGTVDSTGQNPSYTYNTAGTYTVKLTVTSAGVTDDEIKTNFITVVNTMPDLVVSNLQIPSSPLVGTTYAVNFTVSNSGSANAGSFVVNLKDGATTIGQQTISSLSAGQSNTVTINWTPTVSGLRIINATADVNNAITETNETNNNISQQVTVVTQGSSNMLSTNQQGVETDLTGFDDYLCTLTRDTSVKYAGNASAKAVASGGFSQLMFAGNSIAVTAGTNYMANAYVRADVGTLGSQTITIIYDWYGSSGHISYSYQMVNISSFGENVWKYLELRATAPTGATSVYMSIALSSSASGDTYWYDSGGLYNV